MERFPVDYSGNLTSGRTEELRSEGGTLLARSVPAVELDAGTGASVAPTNSYEVNTRMLAMSPDVASRFLGFDSLPSLAGATPAGGTLAWDGLDERIDALLETGHATELASPSLVVSDGIPGRFNALSQVSYLEGFDLTVDGARFMADPRVDQARSGLQMLLQVATHDSETGLLEFDCHLELRTSELVGGMHEVSSRLPGGGRLALQVPVFLHQELRADAILQRSRVLVVTGIQLPESGEVLVVFVDPFGYRMMNELGAGGLPRGRSGVPR